MPEHVGALRIEEDGLRVTLVGFHNNVGSSFFAFFTHDTHMAYFLVRSLAVASYFALSVLKMWAISGTKGSSGLASVKRELMERRTLEMVSAGDH